MPNRTIDIFFLSLEEKEREVAVGGEERPLDEFIWNVIRSSTRTEYDATQEKEKEEILATFKSITNSTRVVSACGCKAVMMSHLDGLLDIISMIDKQTVQCRSDVRCMYGSYLLELMNKELTSKLKFETELLWVVKGLVNINNNFLKEILQNIWETFEKKSVVFPELMNNIASMSHNIIEKKVFEWVSQMFESDAVFNDSMRYFAHACSQCRELFPIVMNILHQFIISTDGDVRLKSFIWKYICEINKNCELTCTSTLSFYPIDFRGVVSQIQVPPKLFTDAAKFKILEKICDKFRINKRLVLMLLIHYPKWMSEFIKFLNDTNGNA